MIAARGIICFEGSRGGGVETYIKGERIGRHVGATLHRRKMQNGFRDSIEIEIAMGSLSTPCGEGIVGNAGEEELDYLLALRAIAGRLSPAEYRRAAVPGGVRAPFCIWSRVKRDRCAMQG